MASLSNEERQKLMRHGGLLKGIMGQLMKLGGTPPSKEWRAQIPQPMTTAQNLIDAAIKCMQEDNETAFPVSVCVFFF